MAGDGAEVVVGAGFEIDHGRVRAFGDQFGLADRLAAGVFDRDVVGERLRVGEVDGDFAGLGGGAFRAEGKAARGGFDFEGGGAASRLAFGFVGRPTSGRRFAFRGGFAAGGFGAAGRAAAP